MLRAETSQVGQGERGGTRRREAGNHTADVAVAAHWARPSPSGPRRSGGARGAAGLVRAGAGGSRPLRNIDDDPSFHGREARGFGRRGLVVCKRMRSPEVDEVSFLPRLFLRNGSE